MTLFKPVLLEAVGVPDGHTLASYESRGGYAPLTQLLKEKQPAEVVELVKTSGLRGRGGAGFSTGLKWTFLPKDHPGPIYLCVNADESEPGTFNNRILMEDDPHQVIEGTILSAYATRATTAYIYLHRGAAAYICGEETGLIESLEGKRAWPRIKPPFPAIEGVFRKPTVVNNIETMACVAQIARRGVEWFKSIGVPADPNNPRDPGSYGPKLYCLSGHVEKPGCYEAPLGITARQLIDDFGGGVWKGRKAKAVIPGGISMGLMTESELDTPLDFAGPGKVGCLGLGTAAVVVIDDHTSIVDVLHNSCRFFAHESCGQCTPCREGTSWSLRMLERIKVGKGRLKDLDLLAEIGSTMGMMPGSTICGLADGAAWPIKNAINKFRGEFEDYIRRTNPTGWMVTEPVPALQIVEAH